MWDRARGERLYADRMRFIRRLDHELKNPLTAIRAGLANLSDTDGGSSLPGVRAQVDRLARLSSELRKLADLENQPLDQEQVDLGQVLAEAVELAEERPEAATRQIRLTLPRAPWPLPPVPGDRDLLFLVAYNLLDNALKYTRSGDTVEVRAYEDGTSVVLEVADTGCGIPPEDREHVFERFFRVDKARARDSGGYGLGLSICKSIVEAHGGTIGCSSVVERGSTFWVRLPRRDSRDPAATGPVDYLGASLAVLGLAGLTDASLARPPGIDDFGLAGA